MNPAYWRRAADASTRVIMLRHAKAFKQGRPLEPGGGDLEAASWKQQLALASYLGVLGGAVVLLLVPAYVDSPGFIPAVPFILAVVSVGGLFFLPFLWWRTTVGYAFAVIYGIVTLYLRTPGPLGLVAEGTLPAESLLIIIPNIVFSLLLIGSSVIAWRES